MNYNTDIIEMIGQIDRYGDGYEYDMLCIGDDLLCELPKFDHGDEIYITYYISDVELTREEFVKNRLLTAIGAPSIRYSHVYGSEWTGYMHTDQRFKVGNHDLYRELSNYHDKYCYLKIYKTKSAHREERFGKLIDK